MMSKLTVALMLFSTWSPGPAAAQQASPAPAPTDLSITRMQRRPVVLPKPAPDEIRADAERAVREFEARANMRSLVEQTSPVRPPSRPDLDDDVTGGIQTQRLREVLPRR
jgi:hypothetical protein